MVEFSDPHQNSSRAVLDVLEFLNILVSGLRETTAWTNIFASVRMNER